MMVIDDVSTHVSASGPAPTPQDDATRERLVLTDAELAVLCGPEPFAVEPFLAAVPAESRDVVLASAYRGLIARDLVQPASRAPDDGTATVDVREDLVVVVAVRTGARAAVALARTTVAGPQAQPGRDYRYTYLSSQAEGMALVEEVADIGLHRFSWEDPDDLGPRTASACLHPAAVDGTGDKVLLTGGADDPRPPDALAAALGPSYVHAMVLVQDRSDEPPVRLSMWSGPGGSWLARYDATASRWWAVPGPVASLRRYTTSTVADALAEAH